MYSMLLIYWLSSNAVQVQMSFESREACEAARFQITVDIEDANELRPMGFALLSSNCFKK